MTPTYVPWPDRPPKQFDGPAGAIARVAVGVYQFGAPLVIRFAGLIFLAAVIGGLLLTWLIAVWLHAWSRVQEELAQQGLAADAIATLGQLDAASAAQQLGAPGWLFWPVQFLLVRDLIALLGIVTFISLLAMFAIWWERKVAGHIQSRLGPMRVGGWHGWSQSLADGIKLICKEDLIPDQADRPLFRLAPYLTLVPVVAAFLALPFGLYWVFRDLDIALLFILAMLGIEVLGVLIAGWASNNKWSVYGAIREAAQVVSYEIPLGMSLLVPIMVVGSLRLTEIAAHQAGGWFSWLAWHSPWTFIAMFVYFIASLASCKRAPFDLPEAESELVAGFHTEYSGIRWSLFFFAEYAAMFIVSGVLVILFLGAWDAPWAGLALFEPTEPPTLLNDLLHGLFVSGPIWFVLKCMFLIYVQMWLRWTLPRLRIDQVLYSCVQVVLPLMLVVLLASAVWELALRGAASSSAGGPSVFLVVASLLSFALGLIGVVAAVALLYIAYFGFTRRVELVGTQAVRRPLAGG